MTAPLDIDLRASLQILRQRMAESLPSEGRPCDLTRSGLVLGRILARGYDQLLAPLFARVPSRGAALAAVGGYGRGAVALRSDLDVRILVKNPADAEAIVDAVMYPLWDATFAVGHQSLTLADAMDVARDDLPAATALLDYRLLAGDRALSDELIWRASGSLFSSSELGRFYVRRIFRTFPSYLAMGSLDKAFVRGAIRVRHVRITFDRPVAGV